MTDVEQLLTDELSARASAGALPSTPAATVVVRARRVRRRRRTVALVASCAAVAAVVVPLAVLGGDETAGPALPTPTTSTSGAPDLGAPPRIPYIAGDVLVDGDTERTLPVGRVTRADPVGHLTSAVRVGGSLLVTDDIAFEGTHLLHLIGPDNRVTQVPGCVTGAPILEDDGRRVAFVSRPCPETGDTEPQTALHLLDTASGTDATTPLALDRYASVVTFARGRVRILDGQGVLHVVDPDGTNTTSGVPDLTSRLSPDAQRAVVARGGAVVVDARSGRSITRLSSGQVFGHLPVWEDDTHLLEIRSTGHRQEEIVRIDLGGHVEPVTPAAPVDTYLLVDPGPSSLRTPRAPTLGAPPAVPYLEGTVLHDGATQRQLPPIDPGSDRGIASAVAVGDHLLVTDDVAFEGMRGLYDIGPDDTVQRSCTYGQPVVADDGSRVAFVGFPCPETDTAVIRPQLHVVEARSGADITSVPLPSDGRIMFVASFIDDTVNLISGLDTLRVDLTATTPQAVMDPESTQTRFAPRHDSPDGRYTVLDGRRPFLRPNRPSAEPSALPQQKHLYRLVWEGDDRLLGLLTRQGRQAVARLDLSGHLELVTPLAPIGTYVLLGA